VSASNLLQGADIATGQWMPSSSALANTAAEVAP
jgi:hypothetical protein